MSTHAGSIGLGVMLAVGFVMLRGSTASLFLLGKEELPIKALMAVSLAICAGLSLLASIATESVDWSAILRPAKIKATVLVGIITFIYVFLYLKSMEHIPAWLTQGFVGLEPAFAMLGFVACANWIPDADMRIFFREKLPNSWPHFVIGATFVVVGVGIMAAARRTPIENGNRIVPQLELDGDHAQKSI